MTEVRRETRETNVSVELLGDLGGESREYVQQVCRLAGQARESNVSE